MGIAEVQSRVKGPVSMTYKDGGKTEVWHQGNKHVELPAMATDDQVVAALTHFIEKRNGMLKTQGLAQKLKLFHHNLNDEADKLGKRVDDAANKSTATFAKSHQFLDSANSHMDEVDKFIAELDAATNGGPA